MKERPALILLAGLAACAQGAGLERITIPPGATFAQVTDSLEAHGVVTHRLWFKVVARVRGLDREVQAGVYEIPRGTGSWRVLSVLAEGRVTVTRFTVPEGLTLLELAELAQDRLGIPRESLLVAATDSAETAAVGLSRRGMEGFLLPETYQVPVGLTGRDLVRLMARAFQRAWSPDWSARLGALGLSQAELITLASIVEGEARYDEERPIIAGVYHNRLRLGMALQADPTVQYAIQLKTGERKTRLFFKDYEIRSPYNTYLHPGLPPGPVNSPGLRSIQATLYPAQVPYLYFVAQPDGHHLFTRTIAEHQAAIGRVRRMARGSGKP